MRFEPITPMGWEYRAADNFKRTFPDSLQHEPIDRLAALIKKVFVDSGKYNEKIRTNEDIPPEVKVWLVVP